MSKKHFALSSSIRTQKGCGRPECSWTWVCFSQLVVSDSFNRLPERKGRTTQQNKLLCLFFLSSSNAPPSTPNKQISNSKHTHIYFSLHLGWRVNCVSAANQGEMRRGAEVRQQILPPLVSQHSSLAHSTGLFYIHSTSPSSRSTSHVMSKAHLSFPLSRTDRIWWKLAIKYMSVYTLTLSRETSWHRELLYI